MRPEPSHSLRSQFRIFGTGSVLAISVAALSVIIIWTAAFGLQGRRGPEQPIAFSHRFHVSEKQLSCVFCHPTVFSTSRAGIPPLDTCMLCHRQIIVTHPEIVKLRRHFEANEPVEWVRVNNVPDFVFFDHQAHTRVGFDCGRCHGAVAQMDRVALVRPFRMGFCVDCHKASGYSADCLICHR